MDLRQVSALLLYCELALKHGKKSRSGFSTQNVCQVYSIHFSIGSGDSNK